MEAENVHGCYKVENDVDAIACSEGLAVDLLVENHTAKTFTTEFR